LKFFFVNVRTSFFVVVIKFLFEKIKFVSKKSIYTGCYVENGEICRWIIKIIGKNSGKNEEGSVRKLRFNLTKLSDFEANKT